MDVWKISEGGKMIIWNPTLEELHDVRDFLEQFRIIYLNQLGLKSSRQHYNAYLARILVSFIPLTNLPEDEKDIWMTISDRFMRYGLKQPETI